jgi:hypothetical protein
MALGNINYEQLIAYAAGNLTGADAAAVESHLTTNAADAATVVRYRQARALSANDDSFEPSAAVIAKVQGLFRRQAQPNRMGWLDAVEQFIGKLVFDSRVQPAGLRYTDAGQRMNLTYESKGAEIDLQAERTQQPNGRDRWQVIGQVSSIPVEAVAGRPVALTLAGTKTLVADTKADDRGGFLLQTDRGRYDLYVELPDGVVVMSDLDLGD